jgi:hypothetical protein
VVNTNEDSPNAQHAPHRPVQEEVEVVFTRENRGGSAQHTTRAGPEEEEGVVVCTREIEGDPLNTQHAQEEEGLSLFVIVTNEDPHNAHQASAPTVYS